MLFDMVLGGLDQCCVDQLVAMSINWFNFFTILMLYLGYSSQLRANNNTGSTIHKPAYIETKW